MHLHHVASGTPVVAILRPARTPKGTEVRTVIKHVTKRLKRHRPTPGLSGAATVTTAASRRWTGQRTKARADGEPDQAAQGAALLRPLVVPQRDGQSGACSPYRRVLTDAWRARRDPSDEPARQRRVHDDQRAPDQDRRSRDRAHRAHSRPPADELPAGGVVPDRSARPHAVWPVSCGASRPKRAAGRGTSTLTRCVASGFTPIQSGGSQLRARSTDRKNVPRHA